MYEQGLWRSAAQPWWICCVSWQQPSRSGKPFLGLSQTWPNCLLAIRMRLSFPSSPSHWETPQLIGFQTARFPPHTRKYSVEVGCGIHALVRQGWVLVNCQNRRNCDVLGDVGVEPGSASKAPITHPIKDESSSSDWQTQTFYVQQRILFILEMFSVPILFNMYRIPFTFLFSCFPLTSSRDFHTANITTPCTFNLIAIFVSFFLRF